MDQPVGISILGGLLIVAAAGVLAGVTARLALGGSPLRLAVDCFLGIGGAFLVTFWLPLHGVSIAGDLPGGLAVTALGAIVPVALLRIAWRR